MKPPRKFSRHVGKQTPKIVSYAHFLIASRCEVFF